MIYFFKEKVQEKEENLKQQFFKNYPSVIDSIPHAIDFNPYLDSREKEVFKKIQDYFKEYPLDDYREVLEKLLVLKIKIVKTRKSDPKTIMITYDTYIKSFIKKDNPNYISSLKHEIFHYTNKNLPPNFTSCINEGITNLLMMKIYHIPLSKIHYLHITIFTKLFANIIGFNHLVSLYQSRDKEDPLFDEIEKKLNMNPILLFSKVLKINHLEYCMESILDEAEQLGEFRSSWQEEYMEFYNDSLNTKEQVLEYLDKLYKLKYHCSMYENPSMKEDIDTFMLDVYNLKGKVISFHDAYVFKYTYQKGERNE